MDRAVVLDTGPAGKIAHPQIDPMIAEWMKKVLRSGLTIVLPEIVDYELRRNFLLEIKRGKNSFEKSLNRLNELREKLLFVPLDSEIMLKAAELWAISRRQGRPTADPKELDGDVILAAQALSVGGIVATENVGHLGQFVDAKHWQDI